MQIDKKQYQNERAKYINFFFKRFDLLIKYKFARINNKTCKNLLTFFGKRGINIKYRKGKMKFKHHLMSTTIQGE